MGEQSQPPFQAWHFLQECTQPPGLGCTQPGVHLSALYLLGEAPASELPTWWEGRHTCPGVSGRPVHAASIPLNPPVSRGC